MPRKIILLLLSFVAVSFADSLVYVVTVGQQFGTIDLNTGAFSQIGPNTPEGEDGLAPGPNGSLLTLTVSGNLDSINPATGVVTKIGPTGLGDCTSSASPCGPNSADTLVGFAGKLYATDVSNNLYQVNPSTGAAKLIGPTGIPPLPFKLLTTNPDGSENGIDEALFTANGKLYATFDAIKISFSPFNVTPVIAPDLWQIDPTTGLATEIGPTTLTLGTAADVDGTVYAFENMTNQVLTLDLSNGKASPFSTYDASVGLVLGASPVPEPSTIALMALGVILLVTLRRRAARREMKRLTILGTIVLGAICVPAHAGSLAITYTLTGTGTVVNSTATTLTLDAQASGSVRSSDPSLNTAWNPVSYSDQSVLDFTTNLLNGNFTLTFADGDMLTGKVFEDDTAIDTSATQTGAFPQTLTFTGGTGEFAGATGSVSGSGFLGTTDFTVSGSGTLDTSAVPEPASAALLLGGLALFAVRRCRSVNKRAS